LEIYQKGYVFNNVYIIGEMPEECENIIVIPVNKEVDKQEAENYRRISYLMRVINYIAKF